MPLQGEARSLVMADRAEKSFGVLFSELAAESAALVRDEIALVRQELHEKAKVAQGAIVLMLIGGLLSLLALVALGAAAILVLAQWVGAWQAALVIGGVFLLIGGITFLMGRKRIGNSSLKPEHTIETMEENKEWLKEIT